jgi:hypothetical protein
MNLKPVSPKLQFLLEAERSRPDAPAEAKAAARTKLAALLGPAAGLGGGQRGGGSPGPNGNGTATGSLPGAIQGASALGAAKLLGVFAIGGLVGGGVATAVIRTTERVVYVERPAPVISSVVSTSEPPSATAEIAAQAPSAIASATTARAGATVAPSSPSPAKSHDTNLAAERAIIERARSALARGDGPGALASISQHEREFSKGQLAEEREVLAVQALVTAGRIQEAAERGARFRKTFPNSLLMPIVDQALR